MKYRCHTNIDDCKQKQWPTDFVVCPKIGDYVQSEDGYILKVVSITHTIKRGCGQSWNDKYAQVIVELHR